MASSYDAQPSMVSSTINRIGQYGISWATGATTSRRSNELTITLAMQSLTM